MDFAQDLCHNPRHHQLAAGPCPAHNKTLQRTQKAAPLSFAFAPLRGANARVDFGQLAHYVLMKTRNFASFSIKKVQYL
jgi:hypothetical protein